MSDQHHYTDHTSTILSHISPEFITSVNLDALLPILLDHQLITNDELCMIQSPKFSVATSSEKLLECLKHKEHGTLQKMLCSLNKECTHPQHKDLAAKLHDAMKVNNLVSQQVCLDCQLKQMASSFKKKTNLIESDTITKNAAEIKPSSDEASWSINTSVLQLEHPHLPTKDSDELIANSTAQQNADLNSTLQEHSIPESKATTTTDTTIDITTTSSIVTSDGHQLHTTLSTDVTLSVTESISPPLSTSSGVGDNSQALHLLRSKYDDIVQSLPSDYEKTLRVVQDHLTDDQICDVLTSPNYTIANKTILNYLMEKVKCTANIAEFCDLLEKITSLLPDPGILITIVYELRTASLSQESAFQGRNPPKKIVLNKDFAPLETHYHTILELMPDNYEQSVGKLQNYISDDQICMILSSSNSTTANKIILDCLIERMSCREELLDLCDQLETITTSHQFRMVISEIRSGIQFPISTISSTGIQSLSSGQQHHSTSPILPVLKKNYTRLCHCLPQDYMKTFDQLNQLIPTFSADFPFADRLKNLPSNEITNEAIVCFLMYMIKEDDDVFLFCDVMGKLCEETVSKNIIEAISNEFMEALSLPPRPTTTTTSTSLPNNCASSSSGLDLPRKLHQTSNDSLVKVVSTPLVSTLMASQYNQEYDDVVHKMAQNEPVTLDDIKSSDTAKKSRPTEKYLQRLCIEKYAIHWKTIGLELNLSSDVLCIIEAGNKADHVRCCQDMFKKWLERDPEATWKKLLEAASVALSQKNKNIKSLPLPRLPPNYVCRPRLLDEMISKLCQSTIDPNSYGTSLTVTGAGGFGKTSIVTALCHRVATKEQFADGVVFIELGPQATDPSMKLSQLYHLLTGQYLKQGDINHAEQEIQQLTTLYCDNLLVIIDDVWHVEDAEPIVKAFSSCKIVLTTRMNDIEEYIPTKHVVSVGPMEQSEAISLLTCGVIDIGQLSQEDMSLLDELAQDVHLWPLLLSLIRGQLCHNLKLHKLCFHDSIQNVQTKLRDKGLTAFDKNNIDRSRKYAVKICIDVTLDLLTKSLSDKMKTLIFWTGIGTSLQIAVLHNLWNVIKHEARDIVDSLWAYGLVQFTDIVLPPHNITQRCVEVHAVISQYIIENLDPDEYNTLAPSGRLGTMANVTDGIRQQFARSTVVYKQLSLSATDYLKQRVNEIQNLTLPHHIKQICMFAITDPLHTASILQGIQKTLHTMTCSDISVFYDEIYLLISNCRTTLKQVHKLSRTLTQNVQKCLTERNFLKLPEAIETYMSTYPMGMVAQQAVTMLKKLIPYCNVILLDCFVESCEWMHEMTPDYHEITLLILPYIKVHAEQLGQIYKSLKVGSPEIEKMHNYFLSGHYRKQLDLVNDNYLIKLQEVAPNSVRNRIS
ncbi:uncharacterized protein [Dysidea avara]|uniref:uncharacterized protein isoform X2 n=1 Tax=Dysidea avara TaxID=196820 RepID=UPI00332E2763